MVFFSYMQGTKTYWILGGAILLVAGAVWVISPGRVAAPEPAVSETSLVKEEKATTTSSTNIPITPIRSISAALPLAKGDSITSWDFKGVYLDGGTLEAKAREDIVRFKGLLGSGEFTDYELYVSIANQYELLGDGRSAYEYFGRAIREDTANNTGLAWHNLGVLLVRLGALKTARIAYERAAEIQPIQQYINALEDFRAEYPAS